MTIVCRECGSNRVDQYGLWHRPSCKEWKPEWIRRKSIRVEQPVVRS